MIGKVLQLGGAALIHRLTSYTPRNGAPGPPQTESKTRPNLKNCDQVPLKKSKENFSNDGEGVQVLGVEVE